MKILVLGSDGRAHALVWKLFNSPQAGELLCAPGNGGAAQLVPQVDLDPVHAAEVARWAFDESVDILLPAASEPLMAGLVDEVVAMHIGVCGPSARSTRIESSRCYAKEFLLRAELPTPRGRAFADLATAEKYLAAQPMPVVLKADLPDGGSGVYNDRYAAIEALRELFAAGAPGRPSGGVVIEEFVGGTRVCFSALTDGRHTLPLLPVRIYDRLAEGDRGEYAPGMGAHTSTSLYARRLGEYLHQRLITPVVAALARENLPYWGVLGIDCIVTDRGPRITGLRCSLRDLEAQVVLPRLEDDLLPLVQATITRRLDQAPPPRWRDEASVGIALVAQGYPAVPSGGGVIQGLADIDTGVLVFHDQTHNPAAIRHTPQRTTTNPLATLIMGSGVKAGATISTSGGHVLTVVAMGATLNGARGRALLNAERISFPGRYFRGDIGQHDMG